MPYYGTSNEDLVYVLDNTGTSFSPDSLPKTYGRDASGNVTTITVTDGSSTWVKTFTRNGSGDVTSESAWVLQ